MCLYRICIYRSRRTYMNGLWPMVCVGAVWEWVGVSLCLCPGPGGAPHSVVDSSRKP